MTYQIEVTRRGSTKILKDAVTCKPLSYETIESAKRAADSHFALARCDWKNEGRKLPTYRFIETAA